MKGLVCCTLDCNLACSYCYEGNGEVCAYPKLDIINEKFEKAKEKIDRFIDEIYEINNEGVTKIIWHGGEPMLVNNELLDSVMKKQKEKGHTNISWLMQSNGTLISEAYIKTLKNNNVSVGVSVDGLKDHHDKYRKFKNGNNTFDLIINNIRKMQENGVKCGTLITITDNNVNDLLGIYNFFAELNVNFNFNALFPDNKYDTPKLDVIEYSKRICDLFDYWIQDDKHHILISPFMYIIEGLLRPDYGIPACHWVKDCGKSFVAIDTDGGLYPCEHWVGNHEFEFGNIDNGLKHEMKNNNYFSTRKDCLQKGDCKGCSIWKFCYGGCPWNGWMIYGDVNRKDSSICVGRKMLIEHVKKYLIENGKIK